MGNAIARCDTESTFSSGHRKERVNIRSQSTRSRPRSSFAVVPGPPVGLLVLVQCSSAASTDKRVSPLQRTLEHNRHAHYDTDATVYDAGSVFKRDTYAEPAAYSCQRYCVSFGDEHVVDFRRKMIGMRKLNGAPLWAMLLLLLMWFECYCAKTYDDNDEKLQTQPKDAPHSRQKRLLWITTDGRLALPPGTGLTITPSLSLPFVRYPPDGFKSNMSISLPFTINFDALGLTDNQNPFGAFPTIARSMGRRAGEVLTDYVANYMGVRRSKRSVVPSLPKPLHSYFQGGERALLYTVVEDLLTNFGMDGKPCLLRTICEVHAHQSIHKFGFIGEFLQLFLTASRSSYAHLMQDYVDAETAGKRSKECYPYYKQCPKSLFTNKHSYTEHHSPTEDEDSYEDDLGEESTFAEEVDTNHQGHGDKMVDADQKELEPSSHTEPKGSKVTVDRATPFSM